MAEQLINCLVLLGPVSSGDRNYDSDSEMSLGEVDAKALAAIGIVRILDAAIEVPRVNLNTSTLEELTALKNVGQTAAKKMIEARPFASLNDAWVASGIAGAKWKEIESLLEV